MDSIPVRDSWLILQLTHRCTPLRIINCLHPHIMMNSGPS
jgi:hypothetical protein